jgi:sulfur carrier protein
VSHTPSDAPSAGGRPDSPAAADLPVQVNGAPRRVPSGSSVALLLEELGLAGRKVAVAVNREVVPRAQLASRPLAAGDRVEILEAVGGG